MRVAYQAGALKALFDAGLVFDHADGTSGGTMNLAMLFSGLSPDEMIERWSSLDPKGFVSFVPFGDYFRLEGPRAFGDADGVLGSVFPHLGIDAERIARATGMVGTFNVCNFTTKTNRAVVHTDVTSDLLVAGISLPIFMPPVRVGSDDYVDSVWIKDANLLEAVERGAEEIWLVWCIGNSPSYGNGPFNQYVHMIELSANGALFAELDIIRVLNERISRGDSPFGQSGPIRVHVIKPDDPLPLDPAYFTGTIDAKTLIARGYADACRRLERPDEGDALDHTATRMRPLASSVSFRESWRGQWQAGAVLSGATPPHDSALLGTSFEVEVSVFVHRLGEFILDHPQAPAFGRVKLAGSWCWIRQGEFVCGPPGEAGLQRYRLAFRHAGRSYLLDVERRLSGTSAKQLLGDLRAVTLTLRAGDTPSGPSVAGCKLELEASALREIAHSVRAIEPESIVAGASAVARFGGFLFRAAYERYLKPRRFWFKFW
jgi:predicted acylesterase/phospholipase RssA